MDTGIMVFVRYGSSVTAAGPQGNCTPFPIIPGIRLQPSGAPLHFLLFPQASAWHKSLSGGGRGG